MVNDTVVKNLLKIKNMEGDSHPGGNTFGIAYIIFTAAGAAVKPHGAADTMILILLEQMCCYAAVHTAAHADQHRFLVHGAPSFGSKYISGGQESQFGKKWDCL